MRISDWSSDVCSSDLQEQTFQHQDQVVALGIGLGGNLYSGGYGSGFSRTPAISLTYENCVKDNLFDENSSLGIGGLLDRKSVVKGKSVSVRVDLGGRRIIKKKNE